MRLHCIYVYPSNIPFLYQKPNLYVPTIILIIHKSCPHILPISSKDSKRNRQHKLFERPCVKNLQKKKSNNVRTCVMKKGHLKMDTKIYLFTQYTTLCVLVLMTKLFSFRLAKFEQVKFCADVLMILPLCRVYVLQTFLFRIWNEVIIHVCFVKAFFLFILLTNFL